MVDALAFQTRARTIDHLGREQIADVPTAISELWKNAYDAYARNVALHLFEGDPAVAMISDDGHGMSRQQFVDNWLVIGTESKATGGVVPENMRQGLPMRPKQGQKGIGRLSIAALGSQVLVISKQLNMPFVACLVDWRLFENPFIFLDDVRLPVVEFHNGTELIAQLPKMRAAVVENISGKDGSVERALRLQGAWANFDALESAESKLTSSSSASKTSELIKGGADLPWDVAKYMQEWQVWDGRKPAGTAMVLAEINSSLKAWLPIKATSSEADDSAKASLVRTLSGFSDPYAKGETDALDFRVVVHSKGQVRTVIGHEEGFGLTFLDSLDHLLTGEFDENGVFRGRVKVFGKDLGNVELVPVQFPPTGTRERIGSFSLTIGAFEPVALSSTLTPEVHAKIAARAESHSGLNLYRDGLRVMPYGRPENDFFRIEERRQSQAGREFWASRRLFGRIAISRKENPNLRDKAGREGLIDNAASRAMQILVIDLLKTAARRYFGGDSPIRKELLPAIEAENAAAAEAAKKTQNSQLKNFRNTVRTQTRALDVAREDSARISVQLKAVVATSDANTLWKLGNDVDALVSARTALRLPPKPKKLGKFEDVFRDYRDRYSSLATEVEALREIWNEAVARLDAKPHSEIAQSHLARNQKAVTDQLGKWKRSITSLLSGESKRIEENIEQDGKAFYKATSPLLTDVESQRIDLRIAIDEMDQARDRLLQEFSGAYEPYLRALTQLSEGLDLDGAVAYGSARSDTLERRIEQIQSLAQIGISVEILSHELHSLDRRMADSLAALPQSVRDLPAFQSADSTRKELVERLRFLSQMQISDGDTQQRITGTEIRDYLRTFFGNILEDHDVQLVATEQFCNAAFHEFPSRVYPVFINLVNNSLYWLSDCAEREIRLSADAGRLTISDTGPGIDLADVDELFQLFFSRRVRGRGVGLYLCKQTLATGGHTIEYVTDEAKKILSGANFTIKLRGGFDA